MEENAEIFALSVYVVLTELYERSGCSRYDK